MCFCFCFFSLMKLPVSIFIFYFIVVMKFADIVAVIIDDIDNDCFLMMTISWLFLKYRSLCSVQLLSCPSRLPPKAEAVRRLEVRLSRCSKATRDTADLSRKRPVGELIYVGGGVVSSWTELNQVGKV